MNLPSPGPRVTGIFFTLNPDYTPTVLEQVADYVITPLQKGFAEVRRGIGGGLEILTQMKRLQAENAALRERLNEMSIENQRWRLAAIENERLSDLISIKQKYAELPTTGANIIGKDPSDWLDRYHIDKGSNHGIGRNMAVLGDGGLAGTVKDCLDNSAWVISVLDDESSVAVVCKRTDDAGIVKGDRRLMAEGLCRMEYISNEAQIMVGDEVVTSAHSSYHPLGVLVGTVLDIKPEPGGLTQYALIRPAAIMAKLDTVLVVTQVYGGENTDDGFKKAVLD